MMSSSKSSYPSSYTYNESHLEAVQESLHLRLPESVHLFYRQQQELISELRLVCNDEPYVYLSTDFDWVIRHNASFLKLPRETGPCRNKLCLGSDGCGNDMFVVLDERDERVFQLNHEIASELYDPVLDDFLWEHPEMSTWESLEAYTRYFIQLCREL